MGLQHDNPNVPPQSPLRAQRMTADEARSVIDQWQKECVEQTGLTDRPAVPDVAEGLDIPVEEVQRLLVEVRAQRVEGECRLARERKRAKAMGRLVEEEARLSEVQQQRAEVRLAKAELRGQADSRREGAEDEAVPWEVWKTTHTPAQWVETKPNIWEDVNQQSPPYLTSTSTKIGMTLLYLVSGLVLLLLACAGWISGLFGPY